MADRFPLILNTSTNQIQEIPSGDNLDLTGVGINNVGVITSGNVQIGGATTDLVVTGDARVTGILTVGTGSLTLNGTNNLVNVGTALTLGHTQGLQFHTQNLHSAGFEVNQINVSGVATAATFKGDGDFVELDVDGHTNLDNVTIAGVTTSNGTLTISNDAPNLLFTDTNHNPDFGILASGGQFKIQDTTNSNNLMTLDSSKIQAVVNLDALNGLDVTGNATVSGNLSVGGVLTYEDVTNVDSVGIITARNGITVSSGTATFQGAIDANGDLDVDGHTNLDNVSVAGVTTFAGAINASNINVTGNLSSVPAGDYSLVNWGALTLYAPTPALNFTETDANPDFRIILAGGILKFQDVTNSNADRLRIGTTGNVSIPKDLDVDGHTNLDNVSVAGVCTATSFVGNLTGSQSGGSITATTGSFSGDATFNGGAGAISIGAGGDIRMTTGNWTGEVAGKIQYHSNKTYLQSGANGWQFRDAAGASVLELAPNGGISGKALTFTQDVYFGGGAGAVIVNGGSDIRIVGGTWTGEYSGGIKIQPDSSNSYVQHQGNLYIRNTSGDNRIEVSQGGQVTLASNVDGVITVNTTASNGAFVRFRKASSTTNIFHCGAAKGIIGSWTSVNDGAVNAANGDLYVRAQSGTIHFTDGGAATSGIDIVCRGGGSSGNDGNTQTSPFIRFRDYPTGQYANATSTDDNNWAIGADDTGVSQFVFVYGGAANSNIITSIQESSITGTAVLTLGSDLKVKTSGFDISETAELAGTSSVGGTTRNAHYDATPARGTYLVHGHFTYRDSAPSGDPDQIRLVLQVDGSDIAHASILDEDSSDINRNRTDTFAAMITVNGSQNVQVESYTTDPSDAGGGDYRYRINIYKIG